MNGVVRNFLESWLNHAAAVIDLAAEKILLPHFERLFDKRIVKPHQVERTRVIGNFGGGDWSPVFVEGAEFKDLGFEGEQGVLWSVRDGKKLRAVFVAQRQLEQ